MVEKNESKEFKESVESKLPKLSDLIQKKAKKLPVIILYGEAGAGKTTLATTFPDPIFLNFEIGGLRAHNVAEIQITSIDVLKSAITALKNEEHTFKTVIIDTVDRMEELLIPHVCSEMNLKSISDAAWSKGYAKLADYTNKFIDLIVELGMYTVIISHSKNKTINDPDYPDYNFRTLNVSTGTAEHIKIISDMIGYIGSDLTAGKDKRAVSKNERTVMIGYNPAHLSKIRVIGAPKTVECNGVKILNLFGECID